MELSIDNGVRKKTEEGRAHQTMREVGRTAIYNM